MKLSTKGRYGLRLMIELASRGGQRVPTLLKDIAESQDISEKYLWQLITPLKAAGLVRSMRGAKGGYALARPPDQITVKEIVYTLEGSLSPVECVDTPALCRKAKYCASRDLWQELSMQIAHTLESITLAEMLKRQKEKVKHIQEYSI